MEKLWEGKSKGKLTPAAESFNSSIGFDKRLYEKDIIASLAHAEMLSRQGIITADECALICEGLENILAEMKNGALKPDASSEDIHTFAEYILTEKIGPVGGKLHTARSRNDQVATDFRLYLRDEGEHIINLLKDLTDTLVKKAKAEKDVIMPGYTHLQRAQPIYFSHYILAYCMMFLRDIGRIKDCVSRMNYSPLGACALSGTTYPIDRDFTAAKLGFDGICLNSIDAVSDRDFAVELTSALSVVMMHISRFAEEIILFSSWEFSFLTLTDSYTTGSSIMPQKKNSDMAELARGKSGRVYGDLINLLTMLKGLPLAYNKDMQEDKQAVFDACDTVKAVLEVFSPMIGEMQVNKENMLRACKKGFINATDAADYLAKKGVPFRSAYKTVGQIVNTCIAEGQTLEELPLSVYKSFASEFENDIYECIDIANCVERRSSAGGTCRKSVEAQIDYLEAAIR